MIGRVGVCGWESARFGVFLKEGRAGAVVCMDPDGSMRKGMHWMGIYFVCTAK
jgi:hypothetical protein